MNLPSPPPFETIESAQKFLELLSEAVVQAKRDLTVDLQQENVHGASRRLDALRIALYNVEKLDLHMRQSTRILGDLRTLRRLLFQERTASAAQIPILVEGDSAIPAAAQIENESSRREKSFAA